MVLSFCINLKIKSVRKIQTLLLLLYVSLAFSQDTSVEGLKSLYDSQQYTKIIELYGSKNIDHPATSYYQIGFAYYMKEDDSNCMKYMDMSIQKDPKQIAPYFIKGSALNYSGRFEEAAVVFEEALKLNANDTQCLAGLGDSYYSLNKHDLALKAYIKASEQINSDDRPFSMIAQIYSDLGDNDKALEAYYNAKSKISKETDSYVNALYNIGLFESFKGNFVKAEPVFLEIIELHPEDYRAYSKLIQTYYRQKQYDKAKLYKAKLYEAYQKGELKDDLKDMFCFDQFKWKDYNILVFERFEENEKSKNIYNKHIFYVQNNKNETVFRVQTEFSPIAMELESFKYMLCASKDGVHYNSGLGFNDDFDYEVLKTEAIKMMEKNVK